jgi:hypothetical protein
LYFFSKIIYLKNISLNLNLVFFQGLKEINGQFSKSFIYANDLLIAIKITIVTLIVKVKITLF